MVGAAAGPVICTDRVAARHPSVPRGALTGSASDGAAGDRLRYLGAYPADLQAQVLSLVDGGRLADHLRKRYPQAHSVRSDRALFQYVNALRQSRLRASDPVDKVLYDSKIRVIQQALGLHTAHARVQGNRLKASREIRIASMFREAPPEFLSMIVAHELAHLKEREHGKAFYQLCQHMEPRYHQLEFDVRLYLTHLDLGGERLWVADAGGSLPKSEQ